MIKNIVFSNGTCKEMNIEQLCIQFEDMIYKFAYKCVGSLKGFKNNVEEFEDFYQQGMIELVKVFELYDEKHCFSTLLQIRLDNALKYNLRKYSFKKRVVNDSLISLNMISDDGRSYEDVVGDRDFCLEEIENKLDILMILQELNEEEKEIFKFLLEQEKTKLQLSKELNISRPTLDNRIELVRDKVKRIIA